MLAFVARRLAAESVVLLFADREPTGMRSWAGLPELQLGGLPAASARELLASVITAPLDERVRDRIVAETRGNPLALLELPRGSSPRGWRGGGLAGGGSLPGRIEASFRRRVQRLPSATRRLLLVAAADPTGEPTLMVRAAAELGLSIEELASAEADGLLKLGLQVAFRHSLLRSAIYRSAPIGERRAAHRALAAATDAELDPDRRAWHRAHATVGSDEDVASELEQSAGRARRGEEQSRRRSLAICSRASTGACRNRRGDHKRRVDRAILSACSTGGSDASRFCDSIIGDER